MKDRRSIVRVSREKRRGSLGMTLRNIKPPDKGGRQKSICGRIDMRIARDGKWFYHGTPIPRKEMVCLFASTLTRRPDGSYWLVTPCEEAEIEVEDAPFLA